MPCPSPKLYPACIFDHFLRPPAAREAISWAELRSRMASLINGQLLSEGEILQSRTLTVSESGGEYRDEGK